MTVSDLFKVHKDNDTISILYNILKSLERIQISRNGWPEDLDDIVSELIELCEGELNE